MHLYFGLQFIGRDFTANWLDLEKIRIAPYLILACGKREDLSLKYVTNHKIPDEKVRTKSNAAAMRQNDFSGKVSIRKNVTHRTRPVISDHRKDFCLRLYEYDK